VNQMARLVILTLSSWFGLGYVPKAPGTFGTLGALPLWWGLQFLPIWAQLLVVALFALFAIWIASLAETIYGSHDVQHIVIDEVAGMLVTVIAMPVQWLSVPLAFVAFRLFDALKPPPIAWLDCRVGGGVGVVVDDLVAGVMAAVVSWPLLLWLWRVT
jgi:phosphatidylglycerophosphatase A